VDATIVQGQTQPTRMRFATVWKYYEQQWLQNMAKEVLCIVAVLLSHQIDDVDSISSRSTPFRRMMKFQSEPILVSIDKSLKFIFRVSLENEQ
jgi:fumarate reductase subunit C